MACTPAIFDGDLLHHLDREGAFGHEPLARRGPKPPASERRPSHATAGLEFGQLTPELQTLLDFPVSRKRAVAFVHCPQ
jgi:hypothetical protein